MTEQERSARILQLRQDADVSQGHANQCWTAGRTDLALQHVARSERLRERAAILERRQQTSTGAH